MKQKFHVGDRVIGNGKQSGIDITGMVGTIVYYDGAYSVEFDNTHPHFHTCGGRAKSHHGWNCLGKVLEPYCEVEKWDLDYDLCAALL